MFVQQLETNGCVLGIIATNALQLKHQANNNDHSYCIGPVSYKKYICIKGAHRDFSTTSDFAQFHMQVKLQHRRFTLVKLQRSTFTASM